jgi:hypothetical protein
MPEFITLQSARVSPQTLKVLEDRLDDSKQGRQFLTPDELATLQIISLAVVPQGSAATQIDLALSIDQQLHRDLGSGWRYAALPPNAEAYRMALGLLKVRIDRLRSDEGAAPTPAEVLHLLEAVQGKEHDSSEFALSLWFENCKTDLVRLWLGAPHTMARMQYAGFADQALQPQTPGSTR